MRSTPRHAATRAALALAMVVVGLVIAAGQHSMRRPQSGRSPAPGRTGRRFAFNPLDGVSGGTAILLGVGLGLSLLTSILALAIVRRMLFGWRSPQALTDIALAGERDEQPSHSFSLIVPARREERVLGDTLDRLAALDYPYFEVLVVVGHDDDGTMSVAEDAAARHPETIEVVVDHYALKNKPRALNTTLPLCHGDVVGVFDAEDDVPPDLLRRLDAHLRATGADVVQSGVQKMNLRSSWYSLRSSLDSYFRSRSQMQYDADRFLPLQGSTVFLRADALRAVGGWDPDCLAEGCDVGLRLQLYGAEIGAAHDSTLVVHEETPGTLRGLIKQRTRHDQGMLQVLRKGDWRDLPTRRQRLSAQFTLIAPFLQAAAVVVIAGLLWFLPAETPALVSHANPRAIDARPRSPSSSTLPVSPRWPHLRHQDPTP